MKSRQRKRLIIEVFIIIIACILCASFGRRVSYAGEKKEEFNGFLNSVNLERDKVRSIQTKIEEEEINWLKNDEDDTFTDDEIKEFVEVNKKRYQENMILALRDEYDENRILTYDEAKDDVDRIFKLFKYGYGAYGYFGGEKVFEKAKETILNEIDGKEKIMCRDFNNILTQNLLFIKDGHFYISQNQSSDRSLKKNIYKVYYMSNEEFLKDENGYYKLMDNNKRYIKSINDDENIDKYIKYSINEDGKLTYRIVTINEMCNEYVIDANITFFENKKELNEKIRLNLSPCTIQNEEVFEYFLEDDIPVVKINAMYENVMGGTSQNEFSESALKMKDYPCGIIDLRGNRGGRLESGVQWIRNYTNHTVGVRGASYYLNSSLIKKVYKLFTGIDNNYTEANETRLEGKKSEKISNENLLFVLIDKDTASAGECFVEELMNLDNVVFVGTNTSGLLTCANMYYYKLKNSDMTVGLGNELYIPPYYDDFELTGFQPDIVIESNDALTRVRQLIKHYNLNKDKK